MAEILTMRRLLGFKDFFPNEIPESKEVYAKKIGRDTLERSCCYFLSFFRINGIPPIDELFKHWFTFNEFKFYNSPSYWFIEAEYRRIKNFHSRELHSIITVEGLLNMFTWLQSNKKIPFDIDKIDASVTMPLLKLVLLFNDDVLINYNNASLSIQKYGEDRKMQRLIFASCFSQSDLINIDYAQLFYTQIYKKAKLLEFLSVKSEYEFILTKTLKDFCCSTKEEFLTAIGSAVLNSIKSTQPGITTLKVQDNVDKEKSTCILNGLAMEDSEHSETVQDDYLRLRNKPFQKVKEGEYRVVFDLFLIKKIYNGLIKKMASYDKPFLDKIRDEFSEGVLVYDTVGKIFKNKGAKLISGVEFKEQKLKRESDFYVRHGNDILLFESKDFFMSGYNKLSYDFYTIENNLKTNGKTTKEDRLKKGVSQLIKNIERIILKELPLDSQYEVEAVKVFPIIVVHDSLYSAPGLNFWIYYWFLDELEALKADTRFKGYDFNKIIPLTILEIDTLILYQDHFISEELSLKKLIEGYHQHVRFDLVGQLPSELIEEHALKSAISFSEFVRNYAHQLKIEIDFKTIEKLLKKFGIKKRMSKRRAPTKKAK